MFNDEWAVWRAEGRRPEAAMFNVGFWMMDVGAKRREEGEKGSRKGRGGGRQATAESARRVAMATKWGKMEEDVFAAT
jgi:hypothetical protein